MIAQAVWIALIDKIPVIVAAGASIASAYLAYKTHTVSKETQAVAIQTEQNTNHLKDELVNEVRQAAFAAGQKQEKEK